MISVVLPVNRDDGFLDEAINSVLNQTFKDFELLIIANNCTDDLWRFLKSKSVTDSRIILHRLAVGGLTFALNYGINLARGCFIARMDADDVSLPERLEVQFQFLQKNKEIDLVGALAYYIDDKGVLLPRKSFLPEYHEDIIKVLSWKSPIIHPSIMARKEFFLNLEGYKFGFYGEDYELWIRGARNGYKYYNIQKPLLKYRSHSAQASKKNYNVNQVTSVKTILYLNFLKTRNLKFLYGLFIQSRFMFYLIHKTSNFRNKLKQKIK